MSWRTMAFFRLYTQQTRQEIAIHKELAKLCRYRILPQLPVSKFFVDFAIPELGVIVEIDDPKHERKQEYDEARTAILNDMGWLVYRCKNEEVDHDPEFVAKRIWEQIERDRRDYTGQPSVKLAKPAKRVLRVQR